MSNMNQGFALHGMLQGVVTSARARMEKRASDDSEPKDEKKALPPFLKKKDAPEGDEEKEASFNYHYCEKLASAVGYIGQHLAEIEDGRSNEEKIAEALVIAEAMGFQKVAVEGPNNKDAGNAPAALTPPKDPGTGKGLQTGPAPSNALANDVDKRPGGSGTQPETRDKAKTLTIPNDTKLTDPELAAGSSSTAMETDDNKAPGNNSGPVPTTGYPEEGVFKEGGVIPARYAGVLRKMAVRQFSPEEMQQLEGVSAQADEAAAPYRRPAAGALAGGLGGAAVGAGAGMGLRHIGESNVLPALQRGLKGGVVSEPAAAEAARMAEQLMRRAPTVGAAGLGALGLAGGAAAGAAYHRSKTRGDAEKQSSIRPTPVLDYVLAKLAEDNAKTNITAGPVSSTVLDGGDFPGTPAEQGVPSEQKPSQASMVASNQAVVDATKREAKAPQKADLKKVLDEPALSKATDSVLQDNLGPVVAASGAKIAGADVKTAAARELLRRVLGGEEGSEKEAALKTALRKLAEETPYELDRSGNPGSQIAYEDELREEQRNESSERDFADVLEAAAQAQGEELTSQTPPAASPDVPDMV